jgi:4-hydroxy-2-oxoglutarate aldolase
MMRTLEGVLAPVITTFRPDGELDARAFERNVASHLSAGVHGIVVTGSTGEAALLDERERVALVEAARGVTPPDRWLIAGTGAESTRNCILQTRAAAERGADAVLVVAPHYYGSAMTPAALLAHYHAVADASPVPVILYTIPKYMHFATPAEVVAELAQHGNIIGIKDSSGSAELLEGYLGAASADFAVLTGNGGLFRHSLSRGARGGILAVALFAPALAMAVWHEASGGGASAEGAQGAMAPLARRIVGELGVPGVKAALDAVGLQGGPVRLPLLPLEAAQVAEVGELLQAHLTAGA